MAKKRGAKKGQPRKWDKHPTGYCEQPDCGSKHYAKGFCKRHYFKEYRKAKSQHGAIAETTAAKETAQRKSFVQMEAARRRVMFIEAAARFSDEEWIVRYIRGGTQVRCLNNGWVLMEQPNLDWFVAKRWLKTPVFSKEGYALYEVTPKGRETITRGL